MKSPRVLLVEDDASLRRFVRIALDELPIELIECDSVAAAMQVLAQAPVQLILTDLMMPGESGLGLLQRLQASPALQGHARVVVLSAGLNADVRRQLEVFKPWRSLGKPVSVSLLERCVTEALADGDLTGTSMAAAQVSSQNTGPGIVPAVDHEQAQAIEDYFEGDVALFASYREACMAQFPLDIQEGDAACQSRDLQVLRRVAHSLKTVLLTLGYPGLSHQARDIEILSQTGDEVPAHEGWAALVAQLQALINGV